LLLLKNRHFAGHAWADGAQQIRNRKTDCGTHGRSASLEVSPGIFPGLGMKQIVICPFRLGDCFCLAALEKTRILLLLIRWRAWSDGAQQILSRQTNGGAQGRNTSLQVSLGFPALGIKHIVICPFRLGKIISMSVHACTCDRYGGVLGLMGLSKSLTDKQMVAHKDAAQACRLFWTYFPHTESSK